MSIFRRFSYCLNVAMLLFSVVRHCCREFFTDGINRLKRRRVASSSPYCQVELDWRGPSGQRWTSSASGKDQVPCPVENLAIAALQAALVWSRKDVVAERASYRPPISPSSKNTKIVSKWLSNKHEIPPKFVMAFSKKIQDRAVWCDAKINFATLQTFPIALFLSRYIFNQTITQMYTRCTESHVAFVRL